MKNYLLHIHYQQDKMGIFWVVLFTLLGATEGLEVCNKFGCFSSEKPFGGTTERTLNLLPLAVKTKFKLFTPENPDTSQEIDPENKTSILSTTFNLTRRTNIIIHGYTESSEFPWMKAMCTALFKVEHVNCILVDWSSMSNTIYQQAANTVFLVGAKVAFLLNNLKEKYSYDGSKTHIIGHSLGAHIAGHAGKRFNGLLLRITGLDPAGFLFEDVSERVRLAKSDAQFVDVIHSNALKLTELGLGKIKECGDADFYPNGGKRMPECLLNRLALPPYGIAFCLLYPILGPLECSGQELKQYKECLSVLKTIPLSEDLAVALLQFLFCDHIMSRIYYIHSITHPEAFTSKKCKSYNDYLANECAPCPSEGCPKMGHYASASANGTFYMNTFLAVVQVAPGLIDLLTSLPSMIPVVLPGFDISNILNI